MCIRDRFWDVEGGRVTIGGRDVREYTLESLMDQVSLSLIHI